MRFERATEKTIIRPAYEVLSRDLRCWATIYLDALPGFALYDSVLDRATTGPIRREALGI